MRMSATSHTCFSQSSIYNGYSKAKTYLELLCVRATIQKATTASIDNNSIFTLVHCNISFMPIAFNIFTKSMTSGSTAAFVITVCPSARHAAMITVSVAPTEICGK